MLLTIPRRNRVLFMRKDFAFPQHLLPPTRLGFEQETPGSLHQGQGAGRGNVGVGDAPRSPATAQRTSIAFSTPLWCWYAAPNRPNFNPQAGAGNWVKRTNYFNGKQNQSAWVWIPSSPTMVGPKSFATRLVSPTGGSGYTEVMPGYWVK
jgi:hypothetical protein